MTAQGSQKSYAVVAKMHTELEFLGWFLRILLFHLIECTLISVPLAVQLVLFVAHSCESSQRDGG